MHIRPLRALVPSSNQVAERLVSPPYDVLSRAEATAILSENPTSFLRVVRPDALHPTLSPYDAAIYEAARASLAALQTDGTLTRDAAPCLFVYEQTLRARTQRGLVALAAVRDYERNRIRKHERTRPAKEDDRTRLTHALSANTGPVFLTYRDVAPIDRIVDAAAALPPAYSVAAPDGVLHRVWRVPHADCARLAALFEEHVPLSYIADGHHRAASAARVGAERRERDGDDWTGEEDYNHFLAVLFPASQLHIMAYNRLVSDLNGHSPREFINKLGASGRVAPMKKEPVDVPEEPGTVFVFVDGEWYEYALSSPVEGSTGVADTLDCHLLQQQVLQPILGIEDPRKSERIEFVGGIRGVKFLQDSVERGDSAVAFVLHPVTTTQLMDVADRDEIMPPKSTWFEPKLRSGFFTHTF